MMYLLPVDGACCWIRKLLLTPKEPGHGLWDRSQMTRDSGKDGHIHTHTSTRTRIEKYTGFSPLKNHPDSVIAISYPVSQYLLAMQPKYTHTHTHTHTHTDVHTLPNAPHTTHTHTYTCSDAHTHAHKRARAHTPSNHFNTGRRIRR